MKFCGSPACGYRRLIPCGNGYGVSVVCHSFSYGGEAGYFECATIWLATGAIVSPFDDCEGDVSGWLDFDQVANYIAAVQAISPTDSRIISDSDAVYL